MSQKLKMSVTPAAAKEKEYKIITNQAKYSPRYSALSQKRTKYVFNSFFFASVLEKSLFSIVQGYTNFFNLKKYFCF